MQCSPKVCMRPAGKSAVGIRDCKRKLPLGEQREKLISFGRENPIIIVPIVVAAVPRIDVPVTVVGVPVHAHNEETLVPGTFSATAYRILSRLYLIRGLEAH